ncbi:hypothetical protein ABFX02_02G043200 [Erythranthe guttata]
MMVAAVSLPGAAASTTDPQTPKITPTAAAAAENDHVGRPPLLPSEKDNNNNKISDTKKKPKSRIVSSRYMSPSTSTSTSNSSTISSSSSSFSSRRFPSPLVSRNSTPLSNAPSSAPPKRSISADRRRPSAARPLTPDLEVSAATKLLVTSTRSLSVSFQGEAFSLPISKTKVAPSSPNLTSTRKATPERRRTSTTPLRGGGDQAAAEHSKLSDQHRWPARNRSTNPLSMSMDFSSVNGERSKLISSMSGVRALQQSLMIDERRPSLDGRSSLDLGGNSQRASDGSSVNNEASDSDSVSSGSTSGVQECSGVSNGSRRGIVGSARFWQETNSRMRRLQDPGSPLSTSPGSKLMLPSKSKRYTSNNNGLSSSPIRPLSPSKGMTAMGSCSSSPLRGHSPSRIRNAAVSTINNNFNDTPSVLSYAVDVRRGKVGENKIIDAHLLRLLYNRNLQWRFVNARTEAVLLVQKRSAEKNLWNAWITISDLRDAVTKKRHRLQLLRQKLKLSSILKRQMNFLEDWASFDKDHSVSLLGATESLRASTLRLPVIGGAIADVQSLQDAIVSAVDIMQAMTSSIYLLLPTVEDVNSLVSELAKVTTKERALLEQCTDLISLLAAMQVKDSSLRTHILQHNRV